MTVDLSAQIGDLTLRNPIILASGTCGYGMELKSLLDLSSIGGFVTKGISVEPRTGNPPPRICETPSGMMNAIGLQNVGLEGFLSDKLPGIRALPLACIVNVYGNTFEDYVTLAESLGDREGVHGIELNLSCPNVKQGGVEFGQDPEVLSALVAAVRPHVKCSLWVKLSPNVADVRPFVTAAEASGADAVSLINTLRAMEISVKTQKPVLGNRSGGLSGPAIRPVALYQVYQAYSVARKPVVGMGGIETAEDVLRFLLAGSTAVQVGTALFRNPGCASQMVVGLEEYLAARACSSIGSLVGKAHDSS
jgi:dihydroorotate dehydrogenase (NAD+) catalytic subunit